MTTTTAFTVRSYFCMIDSGQLELLGHFAAPGYVLHFAGLPQPLDQAGAAQLIGGIRAAFPDLRHHIEQISERDGRIVVQIKATGTQQGDFQGAPASGRPIAVPSTHTFHFEGNLIAEHWIEVEMAEIMRQISGGPAVAGNGHATNTGPFMHLAPTGKSVMVNGLEMFRVVDGQIVEFWRKDDDVNLLMQLGAMPAPQPA
jgi:predicted ester cyclase